MATRTASRKAAPARSTPRRSAPKKARRVPAKAAVPKRGVVKRRSAKSVMPKYKIDWQQRLNSWLQAVSRSPRAMNTLLSTAVLMVLAGAVMWSVTWLNNPQNLPIQDVELKGELQYLDPTELQNIVAPHAATNLYLLDAEALEQELEAHPWVRSVSLIKAWPEQLILNIEEQYPVAFWGKEQLLNKFGEIFPGELAGKSDVFPTIFSPTDKGREMAERYVRLMGQLKGLGLEIVELTEDDRGTWSMKLRQGQSVIIGRKEQERRVQRFRVGYMQELRAEFSDIRTIDLRYTNGFAVEWKQGSGQIGAISPSGVTIPGRLGS